MTSKTYTSVELSNAVLDIRKKVLEHTITIPKTFDEIDSKLFTMFIISSAINALTDELKKHQDILEETYPDMKVLEEKQSINSTIPVLKGAHLQYDRFLKTPQKRVDQTTLKTKLVKKFKTDLTTVNKVFEASKKETKPAQQYFYTIKHD